MRDVTRHVTHQHQNRLVILDGGSFAFRRWRQVKDARGGYVDFDLLLTRSNAHSDVGLRVQIGRASCRERVESWVGGGSWEEKRRERERRKIMKEGTGP